MSHLVIQPILNSDQKIDLLRDFNPAIMTWLVPDLTSKNEIQWRLLQKTSVLEEDAVLRASELWTKIFRSLYPDWTLVSHDFFKTYVADFLNQEYPDMAQSSGSTATLLTFLQQLLPVLANETTRWDNWGEWFRGNPAQYVRWGFWFELVRGVWTQMQQDRFVMASMCPGFIVNHPDLKKAWSRKIICDLGSQLNSVESEILKKLSTEKDVRVLRPNAAWVESYAKTLNSYYHLAGVAFPEKVQSKMRPIPRSQLGVTIEVERYSTMLAEVKSVVSKVRAHLNNGVRPADIAILAPDIELYWPALRSYLEQEGVPVQKSWVARLQTFPDVESWLARLRLACGRVTSHDLERVHFGSEDGQKLLSFDRFKRLFSVIYDELDLQRWSSIEKKYQKTTTEHDHFDFDEFLGWASSHWPSPRDTESLSRVIKKMLQECPLRTRRTVKGWLEYLESIVAKEELVVMPGQSGGVHCLNLSDGEWVNVEFRFLIGLSASALRSQDSVGLLYQDVEMIARDLGYFLAWPDRAHLEFDCLWILQNSCPWTHLSVSSTNFSGSSEAPSLVWLLAAFENGRGIEELSESLPTRWDEIQQSKLTSIGPIRNWPDNWAQSVEHSILKDLGEIEEGPFGVGLELSVSASQIERYLSCPFQFAASKVFRLTDEAVVDLDLDAMSSGRLMHKLFEMLLLPPFRADISDDELRGILERLPQEAEVFLADRRLWEMRMPYYHELARRFLKFEANLREQFQELDTIGREVRFEARWNSNNVGFLSSDQEGLLFRGSIDRVDANAQGQYAVVDYKSSDAKLHHHPSWTKNSELQLALYALAVESGVTPLPKGDVIAALYHNVKDMNRDKGFRITDQAGTLYSLDKANKANLDHQEKAKLFTDVAESVNSVVIRILSGQFAPKPQKEETCKSCSWNQLCRAPHLNK